MTGEEKGKDEKDESERGGERKMGRMTEKGDATGVERINRMPRKDACQLGFTR